MKKNLFLYCVFCLYCLFSENKILIIPRPKKITFEKEIYHFPAQSVKIHSSVRDMFLQEMQYLKIPVSTEEYNGQDFFCFWGSADLKNIDIMKKNISGKPHGYIMDISPAGIIIYGNDEGGLKYGLQSLLQLMEQSAAGVPCCRIEDWPDFVFRGFHTTLRKPDAYGCKTADETVGYYEWMIRRLARYKYTHLNLLVEFFTYKSRPEMGVLPWTEKEISRLVKFAAVSGIKIFPEIKTLGKFVRNIPPDRLVEFSALLEPRIYIGQLEYQAKYHDGYKAKAEKLESEQKARETEKTKKTPLSEDFKINKPGVLTFIKPVIDEIYEVFNQPEYFNIGCDESFYTAIEEKTDQRGKILATYVNNLAEHLQKKGCKVIMWDDMLTSHEQFPFFFETHGGPPLNTWTAVDYINKEVIIASWHYGYTVADHYPSTYPMIKWFTGKKFKVLGVPWFKIDNITNLVADVLNYGGIGIMGSSWAIHMAVRAAAGKNLTEAQIKVTEPRHELAVLAATAEAAWSPGRASEALAGYDPEAWEKKFLKIQHE